MRTDPDVTRAVRSWLDEGVDRLPERVLDSVLDAVPSTPQRRSWWPARRSPPVSMLLRTGTIAAAARRGARGRRPALRLRRPQRRRPPGAHGVAEPVADAERVHPRRVRRRVHARARDARCRELRSRLPFSIALPAGMTLEALNNGNDARSASQAGVLGSWSHPGGSVRGPVPRRLEPGTAADHRRRVRRCALSPNARVRRAVDVADATVGGQAGPSSLLTNTVDTATANCTRDLMLPLFTTPDSLNGAETNGGMHRTALRVRREAAVASMGASSPSTPGRQRPIANPSNSIAETITVP